MCIRDRVIARPVDHGLAVVWDLEIADAVHQDLLPLIFQICLLYTSDAADERSSVDLGGRRIIKKKKREIHRCHAASET